MAPTRTTALLLAALGVLGVALLASLGAAATPPSAGASTATSCGGVSISPASRAVKRGGSVLLRGRTCSAGTASSAAQPVTLKIKLGTSWTEFAEVSADSNGDFAACVRVRTRAQTRRVKFQAVAASGTTGTTTVKVSKSGSRRCEQASDETEPDSATTPAYQPPPPETGNPNCPLSQPGSNLSFTLPAACTLAASDTSSNPDPVPFYGRIDCEDPTRHQQVTSGGDPRPTAMGSSQGNSAFRRMTVLDGDDFWGERCELGLNEKNGPVAFYHEGQRRVTYASFKLPNSYPLNTDKWQGVLQMKQAQTSDNGGGTPVLSLSGFEGKWLLYHSEPGYTDVDDLVWDTPALKNVWTRVAIDAYYSQDPNLGWVKIYIDSNGDGDFDDSNEKSPTIHTNTLKYETGTDSSDGITAGQSIPSHLRIGMYHHQDIPCPGPTGCAVEADNIQVVKP